MAEEKQTPEIDDTLSKDDIDMLRAVLEDSHSRGMTPVSLYQQSDLTPEE
jgi:Tfp pilus assembly ATPase PilU